MPFLEQKRSKTVSPLDVNCHTEPFIVYVGCSLPSADSMNLASKNLWHIDRAMSLAMEKVVVVVVVTMRDGSLGSGIRFDCENLREPRLLMASSDKNVCSILVNLTRWAPNGNKLTIKVEKRSLKSYTHELATEIP